MILYYLLVPFLYLFSYLPSGLLYALADAVAFVLRDIIGYRKQVVYDNLKLSFPEKSEAEINAIARQSYRHLAYRVVENIKCVTISKEEVAKRMLSPDAARINEYHKQGRHVVLMLGHVASWEFAGYKLSMVVKHWVFAIVSKVGNKHFDKLIQNTRGKMGMHLIHMQDSPGFYRKQLPQLSLGVFLSDQSPPSPERAYWTNFLHRETAFFKGAERYARMHNCVVIYPKIVQTAKGYYTSELIVLSEHPNEEPENGITEKFARVLEAHLREHPADWLWSHKRWKHKRKK